MQQEEHFATVVMLANTVLPARLVVLSVKLVDTGAHETSLQDALAANLAST